MEVDQVPDRKDLDNGEIRAVLHSAGEVEQSSCIRNNECPQSAVITDDVTTDNTVEPKCVPDHKLPAGSQPNETGDYAENDRSKLDISTEQTEDDDSKDGYSTPVEDVTEQQQDNSPELAVSGSDSPQELVAAETSKAMPETQCKEISDESLGDAPEPDTGDTPCTSPSNCSTRQSDYDGSEETNELYVPSPQHTDSQCYSTNTSSAVDDLAGDDLLAELDMELSADNCPDINIDLDGVNLYMETSDGTKKPVDLTSLPGYKEMKERNEELVKKQQKMRQEIERLNRAVQESSMKLDSSERDIYLAEIKKLEQTISNLNAELQQAKDRLAAHDASAKKAVVALQNELRLQINKVKSVEEEAVKEKERMTIKYAQSEQKNIQLQQNISRLELQIKDMIKEREVMIARFKVIKSERQKLQEQYDTRMAEAATLKKELEKEKEAYQNLDIKLRWHQNKLKTETDLNKELKQKLEDLQRKLKEAKEETEVMRQDYHKMIKTYQESDEIRSNSLEKEVKVKEEKLLQHLQEKTDQEEVHFTVVKELDALKKKHRDAIEELKTLKDKVTCLEAERITQEHTLDKFKETLQNQKYENKQLNEKVAQLDSVKKQLSSAESRVKQLEAELTELQEANKELQIEMEGCCKRESEHLAFSQKMSDKNAQLQSENNSLSHKLNLVMEEQQRLTKLCETLQEKVLKLGKELEEERRLRTDEVQSLTSSLESKSKAVEELSRTIEEEKDENRTLKRKHNAYTKDLLRQLHQARKRLEHYEQNHIPSERDSLSLGSRTSSTGSLDTLGNSGNPASNQTGTLATVGSHESMPHQEETPPIVEVVEVDKQMLMDKIVRLQKAHARKNEKIEFMEDHINQLVADIQKKTRIIQHYLMQEETGSLSPEFMDKHKAELAKKGGIMASLYNSQSQDSGMSLDLSLEINRKLQAVLEDTLLKNMTYKENLMTLGEEISRLSQENRRLQLQAMKQTS